MQTNSKAFPEQCSEKCGSRQDRKGYFKRVGLKKTVTSLAVDLRKPQE